MVIRRRMNAGPIVDLSYGCDLSSKTERSKWYNYVRDYKPRVIIMGPPCTHFGSFSNLNCRFPWYEKGLAISTELANFAARVCILQLDNNRDFIAENPQASKIWQLPLWQQVFDHERTQWVDHDQCMSGLTIPDRHNEGKPILCRKTTRFVASQWCLISLLNVRCNHDIQKQPHGKIEGSWKGILISKMAQEWPGLLCRKLCAGIEKAIKSQNTSRSFPADEERASSSDSHTCAACRQGLPPSHRSHTRVWSGPGYCRHPVEDMREWATCLACHGHASKNDPRHTKI